MKNLKHIIFNLIVVVIFLATMSCEQDNYNYPKFYSFNNIHINSAVQYTSTDRISLSEDKVLDIESNPIIELFPLEISFMSENEVVLAFEINNITNYLTGDFNFITDQNFLLTVHYPIYGNETRKLVYSGLIKNDNILLSGYYYSVTNLINNDFVTESGIGYMNEDAINSIIDSEKVIFSVNFNIEYQISF